MYFMVPCNYEYPSMKIVRILHLLYHSIRVGGKSCLPSFLIIGEISLPLLRSRCTPHDISMFKNRLIPFLRVGSFGNKQGVCHTVALSFTLEKGCNIFSFFKTYILLIPSRCHRKKNLKIIMGNFEKKKCL
jgi:hypothetical protein